MPPHSPRRFAAITATTAVACALAVAPVTAASPAIAAIVPAPITSSADGAALSLAPIGTEESGVFDESAAEIVQAYGDRLFVVNALAGSVRVLDWSDPATMTGVFEIESDGVANSVAIRADGLGVVAFESDVKTDPGHLVFFDANAADPAAATLGTVEVGALPDMVAISKDGAYAVVANEAEPAEDFTLDPEGSISVVSLPAALSAPGQEAVRTADFHDFEAGGSKTLPADVRIFGPQPEAGFPISRNLEPEYVTIDGGTAYAALQEANAIAVIDLATAEVTGILPLGFKDLGLDRNALDPSDKDAGFALRTFPGLKGMYLPDGLQSYTTGGQTYLVTANEGDAREWGDYVEGTRAKSIAKDGYGPVCETSPLAAQLGDADLGRLNVTTENGFDADAGCYSELYAFGGRSFSIWTTDGTQVFDSGSEFEQITYAAAPEYFNSNHSESNFEGRSDDKGPEPENVTVGELSGRTYAFVGFERVGGIAVYDITDPVASEFVTYVNNRDFSADVETGAAGDLGPEGIVFIPAAQSPTGTPVVITGNEVSGTTTVFEITDHLAVPETTDIQVLSINDFHGRIEQNLRNGEAGAAVIAGAVDAFETANPNTLFVSAGDNIGASTFTSFIQQDNPTIDALVAAGLDLGAVGNHEFDQGYDDLTDRVLPRYGDTTFGLGANVFLKGTDTPALEEYAIEEVAGVRIGFIGTVTDDTATLVAPDRITDIEFGDQLAAANRVAGELAASNLADVIVLLTHSGSGTGDCANVLADATAYGKLIHGASAEIDAIVSGHTHQSYACMVPVDGTEMERPVIQAHQYGTTLGKLDISVDAETKQLVSISGGLVPLVKAADAVAGTPAIALFPEDPAVKAIVTEATAVADVEGAVEVGSITADILRGGTGGSDRGVESSLGNLTSDIYLWATSNEDYAGTPAQIALMNPGGLRADLLYGTDGTMTFRDVAAVQPFANTLVTVTLSGEQLKSVLEEQWRADGTKLHLGVSDGFSYEYDPTAAFGERIVSMRFNGAMITDDDEFTVVTNSFLAAGGDSFLTFAEGTDRADTGQVDLAATVEYFRAGSPVSPAELGRAVNIVDETPQPQPGSGSGVGSGSGSGSVSGPGQLAVTGTELPLGIALGAAFLLVVGGLLFAFRRRSTLGS